MTHFLRYINTDYAFAASTQRDIDSGVRRLLVTYDIACQWGINLKHRLSTYLPPLNLDLGALSYRVAVPKFHLVGHGASCQVPYNLALMDGVGMTHGEGVETVWSHSTSLATWSRENGPAARHQILDDHWGSWNWRKTVNLCMSALLPSHTLIVDANTGTNLRKGLEKAWKWSIAQRAVAKSLDATVSESTLLRWRKMVTEFKNDPKKPNPFEEPETGTTTIPSHRRLSHDERTAVSVTSLRRVLLEEESDARKRGSIQLHDITAAGFLRRALDIEEKQCVSYFSLCSPF